MNNSITSAGLIQMQMRVNINKDVTPAVSRLSKSELTGLNSFNTPFTGGERSKSFVTDLAHSFGGLTEDSMRSFARDLAPNYN